MWWGDINEGDIDLSGKRVRYKGEVQDKCGLSNVIHKVASKHGNGNWPLWSDIYWYSATYSELREYLEEWMNKYVK